MRTYKSPYKNQDNLRKNLHTRMKFNEFRKVEDAMSEASVGMKCGFSLVHKFSGITKMHSNKKCLAIALNYDQHMLTQAFKLSRSLPKILV